MQTELEKWMEDNSELGADGKSWVIPDKAVRAQREDRCNAPEVGESADISPQGEAGKEGA
jgi:hypothetical protein